ncbi:GAF and ANTAR domain-containing protein [Pseudokineococcus marinus]
MSAPAPADPAETLVDLVRTPLAGLSLAQVAARAVRAGARSLPGVDGLAVLVVEEGRTRAAAFEGADAAVLDERALDAGPGPVLEAATTGGAVHVDTARPPEHLAPYASAAARRGLRSVVALPLPGAGGPVGALALCSRETGAPDATALAVADEVARCAGPVLANAVALAAARERAEQLTAAMASRATIEQAKGVLMARRGCSADEAFALLSSASQASGRKLRDLAAEVVAETSGRGTG